MIIRRTESTLESAQPEFEGSWEKAHRNITAAACIGLLIIGVVYFNAQTIISGFLIVLNSSKEHAAFEGKTFLDRIIHAAALMKNPVRYSLVISQYLFMLLPTIWIIKRWHTSRVLSYIRFTRVPLAELFLSVALILCFAPVSGFISDFFMKQLHVPDFLANINAQIFTSYSRQELVWLVVVVCITPAFCEEILFRGYVQRTLERTIGIKSLFITGAMFGLFHMQPLNLLSLALLGILIGYVSYRSKSILPAIAAHGTNNLLAVLSLYKMPDGQPAIELFTFEPTFLMIMISIFFGGTLLYVYHLATQRNFENVLT
jgi:uncharacterized protein